MRRAEIGGIAAVDFRYATKAERLDIVAQQRSRLGAIVDEQREFGAARHRLDAERAGAGEQVEHARIFDRIVIGVDEDIEDRLAQAIGGRGGLRPPWRPGSTAPQHSTRYAPGEMNTPAA